MTGDFNARTSNVPDYVINDEYNTHTSHIPLPECYENDVQLQRNNFDDCCNQYGKLLLEICSSHGLRILNGRVTGDLFGNYTFYSENNNNNGANTIDYTIANVSIMNKFKFLYINDPDLTLSDHCL